jgi:hypothetical protein
MEKSNNHLFRILIAFAIFLFIYFFFFSVKEGFEMYSYWSKSKKGITGPHFTTGQGCKATVYANKSGTVLGCQVGNKPNPNFKGTGYIFKK